MEIPVLKSKCESESRSKYKTEICRNWTQGLCEFEDKCLFAHGHHELRSKDFLTVNYRTKNCKQFHETGFCYYGDRCQFKHIESSNSKCSSWPEAKTASCSPRESSSQEKRRLPVFIQLSTQST
jgi:hypothetical protein